MGVDAKYSLAVTIRSDPEKRCLFPQDGNGGRSSRMAVRSFARWPIRSSAFFYSAIGNAPVIRVTLGSSIMKAFQRVSETLSGRLNAGRERFWHQCPQKFDWARCRTPRVTGSVSLLRYILRTWPWVWEAEIAYLVHGALKWINSTVWRFFSLVPLNSKDDAHKKSLGYKLETPRIHLSLLQ